ncbi:MAG TPA: DoxX family protein [Terriglobales bacterium]|nr:DoxX family protein [Terriglobales bacterium]
MNKPSGLHACGLAVLRIVVGVIFVMHGWQKLSWGFQHVGEFLGSLHVPLPTVAAVLLTLVEFLGGIFLIIGVLTRYVAALLAVDMLLAIILVHAKNGFFTSNGGVEFPLLLLAANLTLIMSGAGTLSVSALRKKAGPQP